METSVHAADLPAAARQAADLQAARDADSANPLALWHLLSLDAPTVATLWTWFAARRLHVSIAPAILPAMFLAVWLLYAADRLLDSRPGAVRGAVANPLPGQPPGDRLQPRHIFHLHHRRRFLLAAVPAVMALAALIATFPREIFLRYSALAALLILWFAVIHLLGAAKPLPKELLVGPFFAAAVFMPFLSAASPASVIAAALFALLCTLNCLYIHAWEHEAQSAASAHAATRNGIRALPALSLLGTVLPLALTAFDPARAAMWVALAIASALMAALNRMHRRIDSTSLRAAADLVLLSPLLVVPFLR